MSIEPFTIYDRWQRAATIFPPTPPPPERLRCWANVAWRTQCRERCVTEDLGLCVAHIAELRTEDPRQWLVEATSVERTDREHDVMVTW